MAGPQATLTFSIWNAAAPGAGQKVWGDFPITTDIINSSFSVKLGIGTTVPAAKLDVVGNIRENEQHVPSAGEDLRIVRGNINDDGTVASVRAGNANTGPGYSSSYNPAGEIYTITFNPAFTGVPTLTGNVMLPQDDNFVTIHTLTTTECTLILRDNGDSDTRNPGPFTFIAVGPR